MGRSTSRFQGRAKIVDADGGTNYRVRVKDIKVVRFNGNGNGYVKVRSAGDHDGWFGRVDRGRTRFFNPCQWPTHTFEVRATFSWKTPAGVTTRRWGRRAPGQARADPGGVSGPVGWRA